jgi:hypothetical protein
MKIRYWTKSDLSDGKESNAASRPSSINAPA